MPPRDHLRPRGHADDPADVGAVPGGASARPGSTRSAFGRCRLGGLRAFVTARSRPYGNRTYRARESTEQSPTPPCWWWARVQPGSRWRSSSLGAGSPAGSSTAPSSALGTRAASPCRHERSRSSSGWASLPAPYPPVHGFNPLCRSSPRRGIRVRRARRCLSVPARARAEPDRAPALGARCGGGARSRADRTRSGRRWGCRRA